MKTRVTKLIGLLLLLSLLVQVPVARAASLTDLQRQKDAAARQAADAQKAADQKAAEASAIKTQINQIDKQIDETEAAISTTASQIEATNTQIETLSTQILIQEDNLNKEESKMSKVLSAWYMEGDNSGLFNALINSNSLSEVITREEYYNSISQQIELSMEKINKIKADLGNQKEDANNKKLELVKLQNEQESYRSIVMSRKSQKDMLLSSALTQKKDYLNQVSKLQSEIHNISDAIYAERQRLAKSSSEKSFGGSSDYPFSSIDEPDPWLFMTRECTSYAAWYWNAVLKKRFINTRPGSGSAWNWPALATDQDYSVSNTPRVGAIVSWRQTGSMPYGHVAIVERVNDNGTIDLSEFNWEKYKYSYRTNVNPGYYGSYSYIY